MRTRFPCLALALAVSVLWGAVFISPAHAAAGGGHSTLDGSGLSLWWVVPFLGILLSIAIVPLISHHFWERYYGRITAAWTALTVTGALWTLGWDVTLHEAVKLVLHEYLPFVLLLLALYTVAGGVFLDGRLPSSPLANTLYLAAGIPVASLVGTTGAAILLFRPLMRSNHHRSRKVHIVIWFIFIICNVGGSLTPLGDPPLLLGFLKGVDFFWPTLHLLMPMLMVSAPLLAAFYVLDSWMVRRHEGPPHTMSKPSVGESLRLVGHYNILLLLGIVGTVLLSGLWQSGVSLEIVGVTVSLEGLVRDVAMVVFVVLSLAITPGEARAGNGFNWAPMLEVAKLFAGIFVTIVPVIAILNAGADGAAAWLIGLVTADDGSDNTMAYFWLTGVLSGFLDNAPTYLVFFNSAGGDPEMLMTTGSQTLTAISAGAVFMGALTYIGNAPNIMVRSIASMQGVPMPGFLGYMGWSCAFLLPVCLVFSFLYF